MASGHWDVEVDDDEALRKLKQFAAGLLDLRPFWPLVIPLFIGWMRKQFETEGSYSGRPWAQLSPAYASWKMQHYPGKGILEAEGDLRKAASSPGRNVSARSLELTVDWAGQKGKAVDLAWHQRGTGHMPARPLLFDQLPAAAREELDRTADFYVSELKRRIGL